MSGQAYGRLLNDLRQAGIFVDGVLQPGDTDGYYETHHNDIIKRIASAEKQLVDIMQSDTLSSRDNRIPDYSSDSARIKLRKEIYNDLINRKRLDDDEKISLGNGGALPKTKLKKNRQAFYLVGLPASGKSEISNIISDSFGAMTLDSDYAKRKFPEYDSCAFGAAVVHPTLCYQENPSPIL